MKKPIKFQINLGEEDSTQLITDLGNGQVGIVHDSEYHDDLFIVDINDGKISWMVERFDFFGGVTVPFFDENALYASFIGDPKKLKENPFAPRTQTFCAFEPDTGKQLWACSMGNGQYQFMVPPAMTKTHIASVNSNNDKMTIISKDKGKKTHKVKLEHGMSDYEPYLLTWGEKLVTIGNVKRTKQFAFDVYDPATEEVFVETLGIFPDKGEKDIIDGIDPFIIGDCLYFTTKRGLFCKYNLAEKKIVQHQLVEIVDGYSPRYKEKVMFHEGLACFVMSYQDITYSYVYDIEKDTCEVKTFKLDNWWTQLYDGKCYHLSKKGLVEVDFLGDGSSREILLEDWDKHITSTFLSCSKSGEEWLIEDGKLLVMPSSKKNKIHTTGNLICWEI